MASRVTQKQMFNIFDIVKEQLGKPKNAWSKDSEGYPTAIIGAWSLYGVDGGWNIHEIVTDGGAVKCIIGHGLRSTREMYNILWAMTELHYQGYLKGKDNHD